jgi:hypothetical protein
MNKDITALVERLERDDPLSVSVKGKAADAIRELSAENDNLTSVLTDLHRWLSSEKLTQQRYMEDGPFYGDLVDWISVLGDLLGVSDDRLG